MKDAKPHIALCLNDPDVVRVLSSRLEANFKVSFAHFFDEDTESHVWRMAGIARLIGAQLGWDSKELDELQYAAAMHDTGKIWIPSDILTKSGRLNTAEWEIMKTHAKIGYELLSYSDHPILKMAADLALHHHERWDGTGYPEGLSGEKISLSARVVAVADVFDALTSDRPYKKAWPVDVAFKAIEEDSGSHFDPTVVSAFLSARSNVEALIIHWNEVGAKRISERGH